MGRESAAVQRGGEKESEREREREREKGGRGVVTVSLATMAAAHYGAAPSAAHLIDEKKRGEGGGSGIAERSCR